MLDTGGWLLHATLVILGTCPYRSALEDWVPSHKLQPSVYFGWGPQIAVVLIGCGTYGPKCLSTFKFPVNMKIPKKTSFLNFVKSNVLSNLFHEKNLGSNPSPQFLVFNFKGKVIFTKMLCTRLYKVVEKPNLLAE